MRRQDIQLLAAARQGDAMARCEIGRRYLSGGDGFARHVGTGLDYLCHPSVRHLPAAAGVIAECLSLEELLKAGESGALSLAAQSGNLLAQVKLAAWLLTMPDCLGRATRWLQSAASQGNHHAMHALQARRKPEDGQSVAVVLLQGLTESGAIHGGAVALFAAREALASCDLPRLRLCLLAATSITAEAGPDLAECVSAAVHLAEETGQASLGLHAAQVQSCLDLCSQQGDPRATYALGRALCGIAVGFIPADRVASASNLRKGTALLMRAADQGQPEAWLHLYRVSSDHRSSVANPHMARIFLERAADHGQVEAQRLLGALMLRESTRLADSEKAIHWLHQAAGHGDVHAQHLMRSLVLPVDGRDSEARQIIDVVQRTDPWLANRLRLSRHFGLTRLEALTVDPVDGIRPWGLVVGRNPYIAQIRLSAPRAIPGLSPEALTDLRAAASLFKHGQQRGGSLEGDLRQRSRNQRRAFDRLGVGDTLFFARASATALDTLRIGTKWAYGARQMLKLALCA